MKNKIAIITFILVFLMVDAMVSASKKERIIEEKDEEVRAVYISYLEYYDNFYGGASSINQNKIDKMIDNVKEYGLNTIILHVSPFSDSIYDSRLFPYSMTLTGQEGKNPGFDYLAYFIKKAHMKNIKIYAWINPYRISFKNNWDDISPSNPAYTLMNTTSVKVDDNGIYYNPASEIVKNLLLRQIEELIHNYDIDGIHFDDYFYLQKDIDKLEYENYLKNYGEISLLEFRLMQTNDLIKKVHNLTQSNNILFSIAPDGNINNNYLYHYADVKTWLSSNEYVDMIMPQLYYGLNNEYLPFNVSLNAWTEINVSNIPMVPILAFYKVGVIDNDAGSGMYEWINNSDIITKQIAIIRGHHLSGYGLFRYDFMYNSDYVNAKNVNEMLNIKKINEKDG